MSERFANRLRSSSPYETREAIGERVLGNIEISLEVSEPPNTEERLLLNKKPPEVADRP
jgi:hypothetical protein